MAGLLNSISENNVVLIVCAVMSIIALFLAVAASIEVFGNYKRKKRETVKDEKETNTQINIKEDANIKYVEENEELEKTKAKIELAKLKERLVKEEEEKKKLLELNLALANSKTNVALKEQIIVDEDITKNNLEPVSTSSPDSKPEQTIKQSSSDINKQTIVEENICNLEGSEKAENISKKNILKDNETKIDKYLSSNRYDVNKNNVNIEKNSSNSNIIENKIDERQSINEINDETSNLTTDDKNSLYEKLEEENAIISYEELKKSTNFGYTDDEMNRYVDEEDAIISIQELEKLYKESKELTEVKLDSFDIKRVEDLPKISDENKFQSTPFISPVYGLGVTEESLSLEQTANLEKLNEEIRKTNEFLKTLKELKKNLQ